MSDPQDLTPMDLPHDGDPSRGEQLQEVNHADRHAVELARVRASVLNVRDPQPSP